MILRLLLLCLPLLLASAPTGAALPRVRLETSLGPITVELDTKRAPITATNFLRYVQDRRFDGTTFYRAARNRRDPKVGLVQGGVNHRVARSRAPIAHEPTSRTGLRHVDGTLSMARNAPGTAMGDFFISIGPSEYLDARPGAEGYAAFGQVVGGMATARRILTLPTHPGGWSKLTIGQSIVEPVRIFRARRIS